MKFDLPTWKPRGAHQDTVVRLNQKVVEFDHSVVPVCRNQSLRRVRSGSE